MNAHDPTLVSVAIPVYNGANYLRQAIDSALSQTYPHIEVLVVNDGSNDGGETERIALSYGERIRYFAKENGGVASALNLGLRKMRGAYFAWLSHDDVFLPEKTSLQVDFLRKNEAFAACYSDYFRIDSEGRILREIRTPWLPRQKALRSLFARQYINGSTVMAGRECFERVGPFDEKLRYTQDMEMWFRLLQYFEFGRVPHPLSGWRVHPGQGSRESLPHQKEAQEVLERLFSDLGGKGLLGDGKKKAGDLENLARLHIWFGRSVSRGRGWYDVGEEHLRRALSLWPSPRNPARFLLLLNTLTPLYHRCSMARAGGPWLAVQTRFRSWPEKDEDPGHSILVPVAGQPAAGNLPQGAGRRHRPLAAGLGDRRRRLGAAALHPFPAPPVADRGGAGRSAALQVQGPENVSFCPMSANTASRPLNGPRSGGRETSKARNAPVAGFCCRPAAILAAST